MARSAPTEPDVKLATYVFEKVLNLPMDFFERTQVGIVAHHIREIFKIRTFLMGQLFGTILDATTLDAGRCPSTSEGRGRPIGRRRP